MNSQRILAEHIALVAILVKSPATLVAEFNELKAALNHSAIGLLGEAIEIQKAVFTGDNDNLLEEAGDYLFYHLDISGIVGFDFKLHRLYGVFFSGEVIPDEILVELNKILGITMEQSDEISEVEALLFASGEIGDHIKKIVIYGQPLEDHVSILHDLLFATELMLGSLLASTLGQEVAGTAILNARQHNLDKLAKRYPKGYSDAAAKARADKADEVGAAADLAEDHHRDHELKQQADRPEREVADEDRI